MYCYQYNYQTILNNTNSKSSNQLGLPAVHQYDSLIGGNSEYSVLLQCNDNDEYKASVYKVDYSGNAELVCSTAFDASLKVVKPAVSSTHKVFILHYNTQLKIINIDEVCSVNNIISLSIDYDHSGKFSYHDGFFYGFVRRTETDLLKSIYGMCFSYDIENKNLHKSQYSKYYEYLGAQNNVLMYTYQSKFFVKVYQGAYAFYSLSSTQNTKLSGSFAAAHTENFYVVKTQNYLLFYKPTSETTITLQQYTENYDYSVSGLSLIGCLNDKVVLSQANYGSDNKKYGAIVMFNVLANSLSPFLFYYPNEQINNHFGVGLVSTDYYQLVISTGESDDGVKVRNSSFWFGPSICKTVLNPPSHDFFDQPFNWWGLLAFAAIVAVLVVGVWYTEKNKNKNSRPSDNYVI
eukprot:TRINITY_DN4532_c0_g1_i1.p1 TRINITY_DN4532_c0_g1~~TRINITY_DN4532_c0_g1_i1.p1  ORF type:complete len:432 (+),score=87.90 TRINITY_DN4532_c0_g1_i1:83-1297(+)